MTAKPRHHDDETPAPPCYVPEEELERERQRSSTATRIGELQGNWSLLLKALLGFMPLFLPVLIGWCVWVTSRIYELETKHQLTQQAIAQIAVNTATLARHEKSLVEIQEFAALGGRFTADMAENQRLRIMQDVGAVLSDKVDTIRKDINDLQLSVSRLMLQLERPARGDN